MPTDSACSNHTACVARASRHAPRPSAASIRTSVRSRCLRDAARNILRYRARHRAGVAASARYQNAIDLRQRSAHMLS
eukprot:scaffold21910_cov72-Phaeocystis_antarctica.AAC.1